MKAIFKLLLCATILINASSCVLYVNPKHDNGKHKGWYKQPHNSPTPEHHEDGNGKGNEKGTGNGNGNGKKKGH